MFFMTIAVIPEAETTCSSSRVTVLASAVFVIKSIVQAQKVRKEILKFTTASFNYFKLQLIGDVL